MSRSNNEEQLKNPAKRWFKWSGKTGSITYYDKELKEDVPVDMPFTFLVLDQLSVVSGFSESDDKGIYSNEVRDTTKSPLNVRCGKNTLEIGLYNDIKDAVKAKGGKFAKSVYIAYKSAEGLEIGNFHMGGSSLSGGEHKVDKKEKIKLGGWMDFCKQADVYKGAVKMELEPRVCTKGANDYRIPKYTLIPTTPETDVQAIELDKKLQEFLAVYLKKDFTKPEESSNETLHEAAPEVEDEGDGFVSQRERIIHEQKIMNEANEFFENVGDSSDLPF